MPSNIFRRLLGWLFGGNRPGSIPATPRAPGPPPPEGDPSPRTTPTPKPIPPIEKKEPSTVGAGDFLPITRDEIVTAGRGLRLFGNPWFGRRDLIPPADDPRTALIDRALITHGLIAPEQLAEIHNVGAEMERVRPTLAGIEHRAGLAGEAAVQAERDRRAALKAQKKAEAAERKRLRDEAIAHRRATDIIFLGRGVSARLNDRTSDLEALRAAGLPELSNPAEIAEALGLSIPKLRWLAFHTEVASRVHYVRFEVPKRSGGTRVLHAPHRTLALAQNWIFENILNHLSVEDQAHGFIKGRGIATNAGPHAGRSIIVNLDLKDFFPSIILPRVRAVFQRSGYSPAVSTILGLLCTECPRKIVQYEGSTYYVATGPRGLPQGACTSPGLSNQVARRLDRRLRGLADKINLAYTRYADDLTFSGGHDLEDRLGYLMARVRHISTDEGFTVNESKSRVLGRNTAQLVTGLVVNDRPKVRRSEVRRLRAILHRARIEGLNRQNRDNRPDFRAWLRGKIAFVAMMQPELGAKMRAELEALGG